MKKVKIFFTALLVLVTSAAFAQNITVTGTVTDASSGEPVPFASLQLKGTSTGTVADVDGKFSISVPADGTLVFSSLGYHVVEVAVNGKRSINVEFHPDSEYLDEVVVTAQGLTRKQKALGYSTQKVTGEELTISRQSDLGNAIAGKVSGVQFFGGAGSSFDSGTIILRGSAPLSKASSGELSVNEPIYVVDGTITNKNAVNMDDVESINVLKGPAATALYGSRGADGAIIITTKSAESGKGTIDFSHTTMVETFYNHYKLQNLYGGGYYAYVFGEDYGTDANDLFDDYTGPIESLHGAKIVDWSNDASWGPKFDSSVKYVTPLSLDPTSSKYGVADTWENHLNLGDLYQVGVANITNVAFSKSWKDLSTRMSFTNNSRKGIQANSDAVRRNLSFKASYSPATWLNVSLDYKYSYRRDHNAAEAGYGGERTMLGEYVQWGQTNVNIKDYKDYMRPDGTWRSWNITSQSNFTAKYHDNPYAVFNEYNIYDTYQWNVFSGDATVNLPFNIKAGVRFNANIRNQIHETKAPAGSVNFTSWYYQYQNNLLDTTIQGHLTWGDSFVNDRLTVEAAAFIEERNYKYNLLSAYTNDSYDLSINNYYNLAASSGTTAIVTNTTTQYAERSIYGTATIGWDDTYFIDGSLRNDWSSTLSPENNSYLYGGLSVSVIASNWFKNASWLNMWKIRGSAAQLGSSLDPYNIYPTYTLGTKYNNNSTMYESSTQINYNIEPTISTSYEVGMEWRMFANRFYGDLNFYNRDNKNQIISASSAAESGYSTRTLNAGLIRNRGVEVMLGGIPVKTKDFAWNLDFNISRNVNTLVKLTDDIKSYQMYYIGFFSRMYLWAEEGKPLGVIKGNTWNRDEQGRIIFDESGYPTFNYNVDDELGCFQPDFTGGFSTRFSYKGFTLSAAFDFSVGGQIVSFSNMWGQASGTLKETAVLNDKGINVREPVSEGGGVHLTGVDENGNPVDTYIPAAEYYMDYACQVWDEYVYDRTYVKLRELSLTYNLPKKFLNKLNIGLSRASVSVVANNPWLIYSAVPNIDPSELGTSYYEGGAAPSTRSFGITLNLTF